MRIGTMILCSLACMHLSALALAASYTLAPTEDVSIDGGSPDTNFQNEGIDSQYGVTSCIVGSREMFMLQWDNLPFGHYAVGDATLTVRFAWVQAHANVAISLFELVGGRFEEDTVTYNSYVTSGGITSVLGEMLTPPTAESGFVDFTVPQAALQKLLDRTVDGLALYAPGTLNANHCIKPKEIAVVTSAYVPWLRFEARPAAALGDANADGRVDDADLNLVLAHWGDYPRVWGEGDFNDDYRVDDQDLSILLGNWGAGISVPEPASGGLLAVATAVLCRRPRKSRPRR